MSLLLFAAPSGGEWIILFLIIGGILMLPKIFYLITLQSALASVSTENRTMPPGQVWLLLIPLFSIVWHFIVVKNVSESLEAEARVAGVVPGERRPGYSVGLAMCIMDCMVIIPIVNIITGMASFVCWIVYWVKVASYKNRITYARMGLRAA